MPKEVERPRSFDRMLHARLSQFNGWLSPAAAYLALSDWFAHLAISPEEQLDIADKARQKWFHLMLYLGHCLRDKQCEPCVHCRPGDQRFRSELWKEFPFNLYSQSFLLCEQLWDEATQGVWGTTSHHQYVVNFSGRQILDIFAPSNFPWTNPEVLRVASQQGGQNFIKGFNYLIDDICRYHCGMPPVGTEQYQVGVNLAITEGKVVYRNHLIELIQYKPTTENVYAEPILIVPAWIMKYYILDLSPHNSMVKYLVDQGHTVFMISWKNPTSKDRDLGLEDYMNLGIMDALRAINHIVPDKKVNAVGYCIGGTLLMIAAALMEGKSDDRLKTITLFAAEVDFRDAGELLLFVDESQISYLEDIMWEKGYLDGSQMAGAFSMLRPIDLIWSRMIRHYLLGTPESLNDLMAWNYDTTRLPLKMHSEYLRKLFLNNDLVEGQFTIQNRKIALLDINVPIFAVSTLTDHVAPWQSVYKIHFFTETDITFVLTSGGHNAGIVSEPEHPHRHFQMLLHKKSDKHLTPELWQDKAPHFEGSWWPEWQKWLATYSGEKTAHPNIVNPEEGYDVLCDAPGTYVLREETHKKC